MPALYRTYRPKRFSEVVGQAAIVRTLKNAVIKGEPSHAYLFCGGRGLGKTTLARVLARSLNCLNVADGESCLSCRVCREMDAGSFLDLLEVDAASNTGVDNVRSLIETVHYQPTSGKYKVYIIDEAHMLSKGAWNALLKTLEEPPPRTVFVLATTESAKVPATINSRAQRFDFAKFTHSELEQQLISVLGSEKIELESEVISTIARLAHGGMRDALTLLDQVLSLGQSPTLAEVESLLGVTDKQLLVDLLAIIHTGSSDKIPAYFENLSEKYFDMLAVNRDLLELLRESLSVRLASVSGKETETHVGWFSEQDFIFLVRQFLRSYKEIPASPEASLPLLIAVAEAVVKLHPQNAATPAATTYQPTVSSVVAAAQGATATVLPPAPIQAPPSTALKTALSAAEENTGAIIAESVIRDRWPVICAKLKEMNGPLATLLKNSPIIAVDGNAVSVGVKYLFHKEQLESTKNRQSIMDAARAVCGSAIRVSAQFVERDATVVDTAETLSSALQIFGGELVE